MNQIESYCDRELQDMRERCLYIITSFSGNKHPSIYSADIYKIALVEINRELDERKIRKE